MASIISEVIKEVIKEAMSKQIVLTPENYTDLFCQAAKKRGISTPDCDIINKFISKLDKNYQDELKNMNIKNQNELFAFMSSRLNRSSQANSQELNQTYIMLIKRLLQSISVLHNTKARELASSSIQTIEASATLSNLQIIKDKWFDFLMQYDDSYVKNLAKYGIKANDDLQTIINRLIGASISLNNKDYDLLADLLLSSLVPSVAENIGDDLDKFSLELRKNPNLIETEQAQSQVRQLIVKRIETDKEEFRNKISELDKILDNVDKQIKYFLSIFGDDSDFEGIRDDLNKLDTQNDEYNAVKNKLENVANSLENKFKSVMVRLKQSEDTIRILKEQIKDLKTRLSRSVEESKFDFLTGLYTKKELENSLQKVEAVYDRYGDDYSICFFDIDFFKKINDNYGHDAGDIILKKVGEILQSNSRQTDIAARFGGEEFVIILIKTGKKEAELFAEKIRNAISNFKFVYKEDKFNITVSCGISFRSQCKDHKHALVVADEMLYLAKNSGRNCVKSQPE